MNTAAAVPEGNLLTRSDTMLGICQGFAEDLGFNPDFLRIALGVLLIWKPWVALGAYGVLGVVVLASRLLFPARGLKVVQEASEVRELQEVGANDQRELAEAA